MNSELGNMQLDGASSVHLSIQKGVEKLRQRRSMIAWHSMWLGGSGEAYRVVDWM